jgi:hypothetical protein
MLFLLVTGLGGTCAEWPWQPSLDTLLYGLFGVVVVVSGGGGYERFSNLEDLMIRSFHIKL